MELEASANNQTEQKSQYYSPAFHSLYPMTGITAKKYCQNKPNVNSTVAGKNSSDNFVAGCDNKKYIFLHAQNLYSTHWTQCCKLGLIPASLESRQEMKCLTENYDKKFGVKMLKSLYFTSHVDQNLERYFVSCITGKTLPQEVWQSGEPNNKEKIEACVGFSMEGKKSGLLDLPCSFNSMLCESPDDMSKWNVPKNCFDFVKITSSTSQSEKSVNQTQTKITETTTAITTVHKHQDKLFCDYCGLTIPNEKQATTTKTGNETTSNVSTTVLNKTITETVLNIKSPTLGTNNISISLSVTPVIVGNASNNSVSVTPVVVGIASNISVISSKTAVAQNDNIQKNISTIKSNLLLFTPSPVLAQKTTNKTLTIKNASVMKSTSPFRASVSTSLPVKNIGTIANKKPQKFAGNTQFSKPQSMKSTINAKNIKTQGVGASIITATSTMLVKPTFKPGK